MTRGAFLVADDDVTAVVVPGPVLDFFPLDPHAAARRQSATTGTANRIARLRRDIIPLL
jgi:hypothetical protein